MSSSEASPSSTSTATAAATSPPTSIPSAGQIPPFPGPAFPNQLLFPPPFDPRMMPTASAATSSAVPPVSCPPPFMPMHPAYAAGQMPFMPQMMPFFGAVPSPFMPQNFPSVPPFPPGPGTFPFMPPSTMFPAAFPSMGPLSTVASSVTPTSLVWSGVPHPVQSATVHSGSASDSRSSLNVQVPPASTPAPASTVAVSASQPNIPPPFSSPSTPATPTTLSTTSGISQLATAPAAAPAAERDDDPVLSAGELRRRQRTSSPPVSVRTVRQPADLPARASSHVSRLLGNIVLIVLILCICVLLVRRLYIIAGHL